MRLQNAPTSLLAGIVADSVKGKLLCGPPGTSKTKGGAAFVMDDPRSIEN